MLEYTIKLILYELLKLDSESLFVKSIDFFLYDSVKILLLLFVMISIIILIANEWHMRNGYVSASRSSSGELLIVASSTFSRKVLNVYKIIFAR